MQSNDSATVIGLFNAKPVHYVLTNNSNAIARPRNSQYSVQQIPRTVEQYHGTRPVQSTDDEIAEDKHQSKRKKMSRDELERQGEIFYHENKNKGKTEVEKQLLPMKQDKVRSKLSQIVAYCNKKPAKLWKIPIDWNKYYQADVLFVQPNNEGKISKEDSKYLSEILATYDQGQGNFLHVLDELKENILSRKSITVIENLAINDDELKRVLNKILCKSDFVKRGDHKENVAAIVHTIYVLNNRHNGNKDINGQAMSSSTNNFVVQLPEASNPAKNNFAVSEDYCVKSVK